jgi:hypothetical protein
MRAVGGTLGMRDEELFQVPGSGFKVQGSSCNIEL